MDNIRTDCYVAVLEKYAREYPHAVFEIITRQAVPPRHLQASPLSPTWELLNQAKNESWPIEKYFAALRQQFFYDMDAHAELKRLRDIVVSGKTLFLVCYEKDASKCHRSLVKQLIERTF